MGVGIWLSLATSSNLRKLYEMKIALISSYQRHRINLLKSPSASRFVIEYIHKDSLQSDGAPYASMHAKCLLADGSDLLVTSANFTFHGLHGNIEIGIRLSGAPVAEARKIFSHLVTNQIVCEIE